jgi:hypothetical protein
VCPVCGKFDCYRPITPYERYVIDIFPVFWKERVPIARFLCCEKKATFSLLPDHLVPYMQYTASSVIGTLLYGLFHWQAGKKGFFGATQNVDPDSRITTWLVAYWLKIVICALRRSHSILIQWIDLSMVSDPGRSGWKEVATYFHILGWRGIPPVGENLLELLRRYIRIAKGFLFGTPSQGRKSRSDT